ncbi:PIG-L family deacetylase [Streptomyces sp. LP05-1]|uniref:PIG-L family deacetylase n=1 Tax=Streptomyces pyxinae TaxID=2970734 RepID=A0ABT2CJD9_9ACTN|nr:PIG-L family deacetylase [Streptomyces sp. LP05-1]MCS0637187.1 PIG-L family deacetylase [Streptomyces sp. LP05-1]
MPITSSRRAQLMQIAAHPDDDLYFMNPDGRRMLDAGVPLVSVYVTAGEHDGRNHVPGRDDEKADPAAYSSARHQGLRQAYAEMLGLDRFTAWQKGVLTLRGDRRAEINTLVNGGRRVELIFLNLAMHMPRRYMAVPSLWQDRQLGLRTVVAADSPVRRADDYDYDQLIDVLVGLMEQYRPTVVHTLDPDPDIQHSDEQTRKKDSEQRGYSDHGDHTAVASFSWAAMTRWVAHASAGGGAIPGFAATAFRGYYNRHWPKNLPPEVLGEKAAQLVPYGGAPDWQCGNPSGCGDYSVGGRRPLTNKKGWVRATHYRHPGARPVVATEPDGRLTAYGVLGLRAVRWTETKPGSGEWGDPADLGGGPLAPALGSAVLKDGDRLLFGLRFAALGGHGGANHREIVVLQGSVWKGLGSPERGDDRSRRLGVPVAVTAGDGRVHLFVRNADKAVSTRVREPDGSWGDWTDLGGGEVQDGLTAAVDKLGRVRLFAAGRTAIAHWAQTEPGGPVVHRPDAALPLSADPVAVTTTPSGDLELFYREPARKQLRAVRLDGAAPTRVPLDGYGALTATGTPRGPLVLGQDPRGRVVLAAPGQRPAVRAHGAVPIGAPALHLTRDGAVVVGLGADGHPWTWRPAGGVAG